MKKPGRSGNRVTNRLVALSSAAVLTVYSAGYLRTRAAAEKLFAAERTRVVIPAPQIEHQATPPTQEAAEPSMHATTPTPMVAHESPRRDGHEHDAQHEAQHRARSVDRPRVVPMESPVAPVATPTPSPATPATTTSVEPSPTPTPSPMPTPAAPAYRDGTFTGWGTSRHGDIEATVVIQSGKIVSAVISQCLTRYSCSWVAHLQGQVVTRQSPEVDYVTGATQSSDAFYYAVVQALSKAK